MNLLLGNSYFIYVPEGQSHKTYGYSLITKHASTIWGLSPLLFQPYELHMIQGNEKIKTWWQTNSHKSHKAEMNGWYGYVCAFFLSGVQTFCLGGEANQSKAGLEDG